MSSDRRPSGWLLWLFRLPLWAHRRGLGWMLGSRFLVLTHRGRRSGRRYETPVEIMRHDARTDAYVVASAFGPRADWYQNVLAHPDVTIRIGQRSGLAVAVPLSEDRAVSEIVSYTRRHPHLSKGIPRVTGIPWDGSEEAARELAREIPIVELRPSAPEIP